MFLIQDDSKNIYSIDSENISKFWGINNGENTIGFIFDNCNCTENEKEEITSSIMNGTIFKRNHYKKKYFENEIELKENKFYDNSLIAIIKFLENLYKYEIKVYNTDFSYSDKSKKVSYNNYNNYLSTFGNDTLIDIDKDSNPLLKKKSQKYLRKYTYLQTVIDNSIINLKTNNSYNLDFEISNFNENLENNEDMFSLYDFNMILYCFIFHAMFITNYILQEKENKIKESLIIAGVPSYMFFLSWKIIYILLIIISALLLILLIVCAKALNHINPFILFINMVLYGITCSDIGIIISIILNNYNIAIYCTLLYIMCQPIFYVFTISSNINIKIILSFFSPLINYCNIIEIIYKNKLNNEKFGIKDIFQNDIGFFIIVYLFNAFFYTVLEFILDYYFDEYSEYQLKKKTKIFIEDGKNYYYKQDIEKYGRWNEKCIIEVSDVSKLYEKIDKKSRKNQKPSKYPFLKKSKKEPFFALKHINLKLYQDEIFAIIGHNGSGKTTLLKVMSGLSMPSNGQIYYNGINIYENILKNRKDIGK